MKEFICTVCPRGCHLHVDEDNGYKVSGNGCRRGVDYGIAEATHPTRVITSVVKAEGGEHKCCPVKTNAPIPKEDIFPAMDLLKGVKVSSPLKAGSVVVKDICGTGTDWITTKDI